MANALSQFKFRQKAVRTAIINDDICFCLADVCDCLELQNPTHTANQIKDEFDLPTLNVGSFDTGYGVKELTLITEPQLYFVMMRSRSVIAKSFRKWICEEVLPTIRKTGSYAIQNRTIDKIQQGELSALIAERFPSGKDRPYAWSRFNNHFRLASYKDLPANRFKDACEYIRTMPEPVPALSASYNYPLESARPKRTIGRTAWMTVDVLLDKCNPAPEMDLLSALEKAGYDVEGVRLRIESMHYQLEEYRKFRRRLKDLCEDVSVNRGRNVNFLPSGNVTARIAND